MIALLLQVISQVVKVWCHLGENRSGGMAKKKEKKKLMESLTTLEKSSEVGKA